MEAVQIFCTRNNLSAKICCVFFTCHIYALWIYFNSQCQMHFIYSCALNFHHKASKYTRFMRFVIKRSKYEVLENIEH